MKIELKVPKDFVGKVNEYTDREDNHPYPDRSAIKLLIDLYKEGETITLNEAAVNIYNMSSTNLLADRINKKSAQTIAEFLEEYYKGVKECEKENSYWNN